MTTPLAPDPDRDGEILEGNLKTLLAESEPSAMRPEARARIRAGLIARHGRRRREHSPVAIAGWGLIAAAAGALVIANLRGVDPGSVPAVATEPGARPDHATLADGTTAELGAGGAVEVIGPRQVRIRGQVLLDVVPGQGVFTVETAHGEVAVLGTRFLIEASADRTTAAVLRGRVAMRSAGAEAVVAAGEQGTMTKTTAPTRGPAPRLSHLVSWVAQRRRKDEHADRGPARSGVLVARDPQWPEREWPLPLRALTIDVHLENQIARVALDQTFHNPQDQTLEGVYKFALPPDAAVARLAMYVDGRLTESAVVERMRARRIYEDIVYQRRDPALLEQMGASRVSMRIFPLFPRQERRVILAYTQPLARTYDDLTLTVPLPDLEAPVAEVAMQVKIVGCDGCELSSPSHRIDVQRNGTDVLVSHRSQGARLGDSLVLRLRKPGAPAVSVATTIRDAQQYLLVRVRPEVDPAAVVPAAQRPHRWVILGDTSASRGVTERRAQADFVDQLIQQIDETDQVLAIAFDATHRRFGTWQDAQAIDRKALHRHLTEDGGLGETDLVTALDGAVRLLDGQPGYIVYVGDGAATGERRTIDQLRDAVTGGGAAGGSRATFIGVGVGDGVDLPTLSALADATGGAAVHLDLGDDLAWRALDLVASLYTPRVTGLAATLTTTVGPGAALADGEVTTYLRDGQVAAGDDIELIARVPARAAVDAVTLRGQVGGRPWSQTVRIADTRRAAGDAGYLPRMWAERRLDALVTAGDRALAPCTTTPCPSDDQRAIAAYHARKAEMVALGKAHFLLSAHTSLIVLENDAMYAQYGVARGAGVTWAPYATPATLAAGPVAPPVIDQGPVWRTPVPWRYDPQAMLAQQQAGGFVAARGTLGTLGSGTGAGYGVGGGGRGPEAGKAASEAQPEKEPAATASGAVATRAPATPSADPGAGADLGMKLEDKLARGRAGFADRDQPRLLRRERVDLRGRLASRRPTFDPQLGGGLLEGAGGWSRQPAWSGLSPIAFQYAGDWRLDDLTEWMPGLMRTRFDELADQLVAGAAGATGSITDDARRMLAEARTRVAPGRWRWRADAELTVDRDGHFIQRETLATGLVQEQVYDGVTLRHRYPELGVETTRAVGDHEPALLAALLPILPPRPEQLARFYQVTLSGPRTLRLVPAGVGDPLELELGADGVIVAIRRLAAAGTTTVLTARRAGAGFELTLGGRATTIGYQADPAATVPVAATLPVVIALPLRAPTHWQAALATLTAGDPAWAYAHHQLIASWLAQGNPSLVAASVRALAARGPLHPAELGLIGASLPWMTPTDATAAIGAAVGPVADYQRASVGFRARPRPDGFGAVADRTGGLVATLARFREVLALNERGDLRATRAAFDRFVVRHPGADDLRVIAASRIAQQHAWRDPRAVDVLDTVAVGPWRNRIRQEAARMAQGTSATGAREDAADRWVALLTDVDLDAPPPVIHHDAKYTVEQSARGPVGWQLAMAAWKQRVLGAGDLEHVMAFAAAAALSPDADLDLALERASALAADAAQLAEVIAAATTWNRLDRARSILALARHRYPREPALLRLASGLAERSGEAGPAADLLHQALAAEVDRPVALSQLRVDHTHLIGLHGQLARTAVGVQRDAAVERALAVGRAWRAMDPEYPARERLLGELLGAVGRDDEAWRYLSTPIDLNPRDGASFQVAAESLERTGQLERALGLWRRAFAVDATNPTWLQRQAQTELALGRKDDAHRTLQRIAGGRWHARWAGVKAWAQRVSPR